MGTLSDPQQKLSEAVSQSSERVAVLLTSYGEVENYKGFIDYNRRASSYIASKFIPIPRWLYPVIARILAVQDWYKWGYEHDHFISPQNQLMEKQRAGIEQHLQEQWGDRIQVFKAFYFCPPFIESVLAEIQQQGFNKLLIYPLLVVNSVFTSSIAVEQVNQAMEHLRQGQSPWLKAVRYIPSFANQPAYIELMAHQVEAKITHELRETFPTQIGIVLAVHGGPAQAQGLLTGAEEGQTLYEQVQAKLINQYPLISIGWINHDTPLMKWSEPDITHAGQNLIQLGAKVVLFKPIGWATDNYETILDVEEAIATLRRQHPELTYVRMECANDDPAFLHMAAAWANPQVAALLSRG
ncbi:MAG: ferrochelatase [Leptolyngbyaceae bacterium]|nr:ferrochelatase [Leptolyngbyaceae bacterium]